MRDLARELSIDEASSALKEWGGWDFEEQCREAARLGLKQVLEGLMNNYLDRVLEELRSREGAEPDPRTGYYCRPLRPEAGGEVSRGGGVAQEGPVAPLVHEV